MHHTGHHQAYTNNLNAQIEKLKVQAPELAALPLDKLLQSLDAVPEGLRGPLRNNGGGYVNHTSFFVSWMAPNAGGVPTGAVADDITSTFGSFDAMKDQFSNAAATVFG